MHVAIVQVHVPHYRRAFFEALGRSARHAYTVLHGDPPGHEHSGVSLHAVSISRRVRNVCLRFAGRTLVMQPGVLWQALFGDHDAMVISGLFALPVNVLALGVNRLRGRPTLLWTNVWHREPRGWIRPLLAIERPFFRLPDGFLAYSAFVETGLRALGVRPERIRVVQNAVATEAPWGETPPSRAAARRELGRGPGPLVLVLGKLSPEKRPFDALALLDGLAARRPEGTLAFVGGGPLEAELRARAAPFGERVQVLGKVPPGAEWTWLAAADCLVFPGHVGLALNQAMAAGCPIVASRVESAEAVWLRDGETCLRFDTGDSTALARQVERLLDDPALGARLAGAARALIAEAAPLTAMAAAFERAIDELAARPGAPRRAAAEVRA